LKGAHQRGHGTDNGREIHLRFSDSIYIIITINILEYIYSYLMLLNVSGFQVGSWKPNTSTSNRTHSITHTCPVRLHCLHIKHVGQKWQKHRARACAGQVRLRLCLHCTQGSRKH
jgi:hypothetical protein